MIEHWPSILSTVCAIVVVIVVKYTFVTQKECTRMRKQCQDGMCRKMDVLSLADRDDIIVFLEIKEELTGVRENIAALNANVEQLLKK